MLGCFMHTQDEKDKKMKIMSIFGTRPEAVKMCPLIKEIEKQNDMESVVCLTGQHRDMLKPILELFGTKVHYNLDIMRAEQTLTTITADILTGIKSVLIQEKPDIILVHGDTTTSFSSALAAFYQKIPIGHIEAGLRTYDRFSPFPEEMNRSLTARLATLHFSPTLNNRKNLEREGISEGIYVTGNTVMDAFHITLQDSYEYENQILKELNFTEGKWILLTAHRRENLGKALEQIFAAVKKIVQMHPEARVLFPMHPNPAVRETARKIFAGVEQVFLTEPLNVQDMHNLMKRSYMILTDSGGIQEEAPACGVPVLVLRTETERPEAVEAGTVLLAGIEEEAIVHYADLLLQGGEFYQKMTTALNPYGDGKASQYIIEDLRKWYKEK